MFAAIPPYLVAAFAQETVDCLVTWTRSFYNWFAQFKLLTMHMITALMYRYLFRRHVRLPIAVHCGNASSMQPIEECTAPVLSIGSK